MKETVSEKTQLYELCRDINNGYFSPDTSDDIKRMYELFCACTEKDGEKDISKIAKKEAIKQIYYALIKLRDYELSSNEYLTSIKYILGTIKNDTPCGGFALWAKYCNEGFVARDILSLCSEFLRYLPREHEEEIKKYTLIKKKLYRKVVFGIVIKKDLDI